jgi:nucleoside-diphosphate-sugar epimerase
MKILVTGASGFVGKSLVKALDLKRIQTVKVVRRHQQHLTDDNYHVIPDLAEFSGWQSLFAGCDVVIHLAARVHVMDEKTLNPLAEFIKVNVDDTLKFARQAASYGVKRFVYISSIKVNGEFTEKKAFSELSQPDPQYPYAISKYRAELALLELSKNTGMEVVIVRPPLVYGPQVKANFLTLMKIVNKKIPLPFKGINNRRSLVYVGNLVDALIACATHSNAAGKTFLVSDGEDVSTPELMIKIANALSKPSRVFYFPLSLILFLTRLIGKKASIDRLTQSLVVDSSKIRKELGWHPPYSLDEGLKATAKWYIENLKAIKK